MANFEPVVTYVTNTFTVRDMLYAAYRKARVLKHAGQYMNPSEEREGIDNLNSMIDGWKVERLVVEYVRRTLQPIVSAQSSYGVGPAQDWDIERPERIYRAGFIIPGTPNDSEIPMGMIWTSDRWAGIIVKGVQSSFPLFLYYIPAPKYGQAQVWPVPNVDGHVAIYTPQTLSEFSTPDDPVEMRQGFREMLEYNLAVKIHELHPDNPMAASVTNLADFYKQRVKWNQAIPLNIGSDEGAMQGQSTGISDGNPRSWVPDWYR